MSYGPFNSATYIFTHLERLLTISNCGWIAGVCCPNQIKNHHFVICRALTSYLSLNFMITNCNLPGDVDFVCCAGLLFTELSRVTPNADAFSGVLRSSDQLCRSHMTHAAATPTGATISLFEVWRAQKERACFSLGNELSRQKITQTEAPPLFLCPPYFKKAYAVQ